MLFDETPYEQPFDELDVRGLNIWDFTDDLWGMIPQQ